MKERMINGKIVQEDTIAIMADKLCNHKYDFFNPRCACERNIRMTYKQAYDGLTKNRFAKLDRYKCYYCTKQIIPTIAERRKKYYKLYKGSTHGKLIWKSTERLTRNEAKESVDGLGLYHCPICGKEPNWYFVFFKWEFQDFGDVRKIVIPDDFVCCNSPRVLPTQIIYNGKEYNFNMEKDLASYFMAEKKKIKCIRCNKYLNKDDIKHYVGTHDQSVIINKIRTFNYDTCEDKYKICNNCRGELGDLFGKINYLFHDIWKEKYFKQYYNDIYTKIRSNNPKFHLYGRLYKKYQELGIEPKLYFAYLNTLTITYDGSGNHHLMPKSIFPTYDNVRVKCSHYQHFFLHFLLALDVYKSVNNNLTDDKKTLYCKFIYGFIAMYRLHTKYIKDENEWTHIKNKLKKFFYVHKL